jgi:hypothetical protein
MVITSKSIGIIGALLILFGLAGCSSATPTIVPTIDTNSLRTEVAATVLARWTQDLALTSSATLRQPYSDYPSNLHAAQAKTALQPIAAGVTATLSS